MSCTFRSNHGFPRLLTLFSSGQCIFYLSHSWSEIFFQNEVDKKKKRKVKRSIFILLFEFTLNLFVLIFLLFLVSFSKYVLWEFVLLLFGNPLRLSDFALLQVKWLTKKMNRRLEATKNTIKRKAILAIKPPAFG